MMEYIAEIEKFLKQIKKARHEIKYNRAEFWNKNRVNYKNNIKTITSFFKFPDNWNVNIIASTFLLDKFTMPYDKEVWSFSDVVAATKDQGYEIVIFFNKTDLEFLSLPALIPIVIHEIAHVYQVPKDPKKYLLQTLDDNLSKEYEKEADAEVRKYNDEFRRENVLEKVMFCYHHEAWKGARKIMDYLYNEAKDAFGGGYDQEVTKEEYEIFKKAEEEKDIDIFIDHFIESIEGEKKEEKEEKKEKKEEKVEIKQEKVSNEIKVEKKGFFKNLLKK